jgi:hypothetical protein
MQVVGISGKADCRGQTAPISGTCPIEAGLLKGEQVVPRAPWEIGRAALEAEPVRTIIQRLRRTGKLILQGDHAEHQPELFAENEGDANDAHHE